MKKWAERGGYRCQRLNKVAASFPPMNMAAFCAVMFANGVILYTRYHTHTHTHSHPPAVSFPHPSAQNLLRFSPAFASSEARISATNKAADRIVACFAFT